MKTRINCNEFKFFKNEKRTIIAIYISCNLFTKTFTYSEHLDNLWGAIPDDETGKKKVVVILKDDNTEYEFVMDNNPEWIEIKSYELQVNEFLKTN